jgi:hypothetical protein
MTQSVLKCGVRKGQILFRVFVIFLGFSLFSHFGGGLQASSCSKKIVEFIQLSKLEKKDHELLKKWSSAVSGLTGENLIKQNLFWLETFLREQMSSIGISFALEQIIDLRPKHSNQLFQVIIKTMERWLTQREASNKLRRLTTDLLGGVFARNPESISEFLNSWAESPIPSIESFFWALVVDSVEGALQHDASPPVSGDPLHESQIKYLTSYGLESSDRKVFIEKMLWEIQKLRAEQLAEVNAHRMIRLGEIDDQIAQLVELIGLSELTEKLNLNREYVDIEESLKDLEFIRRETPGFSEIEAVIFRRITIQVLRVKEAESAWNEVAKSAEELFFLFSRERDLSNPLEEMKELVDFYQTMDLVKYNEISSLDQLGKISVGLERVADNSENEEVWNQLVEDFQQAADFFKIREEQLEKIADSPLIASQNIFLFRAVQAFFKQRDRLIHLINRWEATSKYFDRPLEFLDFNPNGLKFLQDEIRFYEKHLNQMRAVQMFQERKSVLIDLKIDPSEVPQDFVGAPPGHLRSFFQTEKDKFYLPLQRSLRYLIRAIVSGKPVKELEAQISDPQAMVSYIHLMFENLQKGLDQKDHTLPKFFVLTKRLRRLVELRDFTIKIMRQHLDHHVVEHLAASLLSSFQLRDRSLWLLFSSESLSDFEKRFVKIKSLKEQGLSFEDFSHERIESLGSFKSFEEIPWEVFEAEKPND